MKVTETHKTLSMINIRGHKNSKCEKRKKEKRGKSRGVVCLNDQVDNNTSFFTFNCGRSK
jgi:hypothetical protein